MTKKEAQWEKATSGIVIRLWMFVECGMAVDTV